MAAEILSCLLENSTIVHFLMLNNDFTYQVLSALKVKLLLCFLNFYIESRRTKQIKMLNVFSKVSYVTIVIPSIPTDYGV